MNSGTTRQQHRLSSNSALLNCIALDEECNDFQVKEKFPSTTAAPGPPWRILCIDIKDRLIHVSLAFLGERVSVTNLSASTGLDLEHSLGSPVEIF